MKLIGKNHVLFEQLNSDIYILSSIIKQIKIYDTNEEGLAIEVDFELVNQSNAILKLRFIDVRAYSFYWNSTHSFYNVETYKLIESESKFYISFDPDSEALDSVSERDQDFVLFSNFEGYFVDPAM